ncbi:MAG TPA: ATP-binding cassette domain-containing protein [Acidimicrobiales bacterium]|nr:ATP-binding cassette domain-containing protein [Acidimicrobiales bacterium]
MSHIQLSKVAYVLPDGRPLLDDVTFRVGDGTKTALVGANGSGKTTILRILAGGLEPTEGTVSVSGSVGVMPQFIGSVRDGRSVRELLVSVSARRVRDAYERLEQAELAMMEKDDLPAQMAYAEALVHWGDVGGYESEVLWDVCTTSALDAPLQRVGYRDVASLSGGEQKRLVLEALLLGRDDLLLLDEPDNYLDVPAKEWLEERLRSTPKTVLYVSHDRELLARTADRVVTVEGRVAWTHGDGFATYYEARESRNERLEEMLRRWTEERDRLRQVLQTLKQQAAISEVMAARHRAMQTRVRKYEEAGPPSEPPRRQRITMRLGGGRTGVRALTCTGLGITGLMKPFDAEIFYGDRVAVLGANGSGKSHFLRLLADGGTDARPPSKVAHTGSCRLGARVMPGHFAQTHAHPEWHHRSPMEILASEDLDRGKAMGILRRYELQAQGDQWFESLSGGQQARFQILLLEVHGTTLLLLDEPTDNLDVDSAEALEQALATYAGTVVAVTHDRWFAREFDRFLVFWSDGTVHETAEAVWHEDRPAGR